MAVLWTEQFKKNETVNRGLRLQCVHCYNLDLFFILTAWNGEFLFFSETRQTYLYMVIFVTSTERFFWGKSNCQIHKNIGMDGNMD